MDFNVNKEKFDINDLLEIMKILRSENGCPWDREQTHKSIRADLIEETYEVVEAIDNDDPVLLREELGDLLLQVVFHSRIAKEEGYFDFNDVCNDVCEKMIVRHPHVFADVKAENTEQVLKNWDEIKMQTKSQKTPAESMDSVARTLPSLMRAQKLSKKAGKYGFDNRPLEQKIGDMLLELTAICAECKIDSEKALYDACERRLSDIKDEDQ